MAIKFVKQATSTLAGSSSSRTVSISAAAGNVVTIQAVFVNGSSTVSFNSVTGGGAQNEWEYPSDFPPGPTLGGGLSYYTAGLGTAIAWCRLTVPITSVTITYPTVATRIVVVVTEWSGVIAVDPVDQEIFSGLNWGQTGSGSGTQTYKVNVAAGGVAFAVACTEDATAITGGFTSQWNATGNFAAYRTFSSAGTAQMSWTPTQSASSVIGVLVPAANVLGTATLTETDKIVARAAHAPRATLTETEELTALASISGAQAEVSILPTDQVDSSGIQGRKGATTYHWPSSVAIAYDRYASLQEGQLVAGGTGAPDVELYRDSAGMWRTPDSLTVDGKLLLTDTTDASEASGNAPALRIGDVAGTHLRIDGNEIVAMTSDTATGSLGVNSLFVSGGMTAGNIAAGSVTITPVANTPTSTTVTGLGLASGRTYIPQVTGNSASSAFIWATASSPSSNGLTITVLRTNNTGTVVYWHMIGV